MYSTLKDKYFASLQSKVSDLWAENSMTDNCHERHHSDDDTHRKQPADGDIPHSEVREISEVDDINCDITTINSEEINDSMDLSNDEINANMTEIKQAQNQNDSSDQPKFKVDIRSVEQAHTKFCDSVISELGDMKESINT